MDLAPTCDVVSCIEEMTTDILFVVVDGCLLFVLVIGDVWRGEDGGLPRR